MRRSPVRVRPLAPRNCRSVAQAADLFLLSFRCFNLPYSIIILSVTQSKHRPPMIRENAYSLCIKLINARACVLRVTFMNTQALACRFCKYTGSYAFLLRKRIPLCTISSASALSIVMRSASLKSLFFSGNILCRKLISCIVSIEMTAK